ncbi:hypothetical protein D9758_017339 [Tetrapyrgos nigripes]|uniref:C3H1-type domain-containing protein n=1 Tax=Tetrapyrgos nigripes TaxID=182062 RepID=A0A8H5C9P4_9AGAR|nr:hypothetical protein D9758_017339 [Tetrapyrgos nigripes]
MYFNLLKQSDHNLQAAQSRAADIIQSSRSKKRGREDEDESGSDGEGSIGDEGGDDVNFISREKKTRLTLTNWLCDPKHTKASVYSSPSLIEFPDSEWNNLFNSKHIDFDVLLSFSSSVEYDNKPTYKLGDGAEIKLPGPSKRVRTHGDWTIAFGMYEDIIKFTLPWREGEIRAYRRHINNLFKSHPDSSQHINVINYDKAIRQRVASRRDLLLTDTHAFQGLYLNWIVNAPSALHNQSQFPNNSSSSSNPNQRRRFNISDICRNWNARKCSFPAKQCRNAHICSKC